MAAAGIIDLQQSGDWENYHKTGVSNLKARWALRSGDTGKGREDIAQGAAAIQNWLINARYQDIPVRPVGGAWSPSNIQLVQDGWMLNTRRFNRCFRLSAGDFAQPPADPGGFLLVEGGVQIDEINDKLEAMGRSLSTSGASNGQTLPGACATATHGSVLNAGAIQQHVRAVQIVTPGGVHWVEPTAGLMSDDFIRETGSTALRDDEVFAAAQVAVGSLGIVAAMLIEAEPIYLVRPYLKRIKFRREDLERLQRGDFRGFSEEHGIAGHDPLFVMVVANPHRPFRWDATVRFLYKSPYQPDYERHEPGELGAGYDAQTMMTWVLRNFPWARGWIMQMIMRLAVGKGITGEVYGTWGESTEIHKPLADPFTAALFCNRDDLVRTFDVICKEFPAAGGSTALTLRFVKGGHGLLATARWENSVGLDCDGPSSEKTKRAYLRMLDALEAAGIPFTLHWGKFNNLTPARVAADYGNDRVRWKAVRDRLLPTAEDRRLFATDELRAFGLCD